jgi:hypothetical protein
MGRMRPDLSMLWAVDPTTCRLDYRGLGGDQKPRRVIMADE